MYKQSLDESHEMCGTEVINSSEDIKI